MDGYDYEQERMLNHPAEVTVLCSSYSSMLKMN